MTFVNFNDSIFEFERGDFTLNNVNFTNCHGTEDSLITGEKSINLTFNNCNFYSDSVYGYVLAEKSRIMIYNSNFLSYCRNSAIELDRGQLFVENSTFENCNAQHGSIINFKGDYFKIGNSKFKNSKANSTGGAIIAKYFPLRDEDSGVFFHSGDMIIENCIFFNISSSSNGGVIHIDLDSASRHIHQSLNVSDCNFTDCSSKFGGAISVLGGSLNVNRCLFENNSANFEGGVVYTSWTCVNINESDFLKNNANHNAGALYFDKGNLTIKKSNFINNRALNESTNTVNAIFAYDVAAYIANSTFDNGGVAVFADFAADSKIENVEKNNDIFLMDNHNYIVSVENKGIKLNLIDNEITVDNLPSRFDSRDWGWVTPVKYQGDNDDCWAFATVASIETALGKATGVMYNLSQNYVQKLQLKYCDVGDLRISLTGFSLSGVGHALSWYGVLAVDGVYDDRGMIADTDMDVERIHVQDALFVYTGMNDTVELLKKAIIKYGAVTVQSYVVEPSVKIPSEGEDIAIMDHSTHFISLIGWNENSHRDSESGYSSGNPHENFTWIAKDSTSGFSTPSYSNFSDIDYYAIVPQRVAVAYIFENTNDYHVNYQTDLTGLTGFDDNYTFYSNEFTSKYDEVIGAVGTYFNQSGISYSFDVYVNGAKTYPQSGVSEFAGFRTIVLNKYIQIKAGDQFKVVFKSNAIPYQAFSRLHYVEGMSFVGKDAGSWMDLSHINKTVCLKVYTLADDSKIINNKNIEVDYGGGSYFSVNVVAADGRAVVGAKVKFSINGKTSMVLTDTNGIARIKITDLPKKYTLTTSYNGKTYKNTVTVKQVLTASKLTVKKTAKKFSLKAKLKINGKLVKGKKITFKFNGKKYTVKTNAKGIAQKLLKKNVIKKLRKGKTYTVKVTYLKDTVKTTVKVKR